MSYYEQTYGEIVDNVTLMNILNKYIMPKNFIFYDFGSGNGKIVDYFSYFFEKSIGVEIVKERYEYALSIKSNNNVKFINKNFFDVKLDNKYVLLANNLCFGDGTNKRLSYKILNETKCFSFIVVTKKLELLNKYYLNCFFINCSWGFSEIYLYYIIIDPNEI